MPSSSKSASDTKSFLKRPNVMRFMDSIVSECIAKQPDDPELHILKMLAEKRGFNLSVGSSSSTTSINSDKATAQEPKPPAGPPPSSGTGRAQQTALTPPPLAAAAPSHVESTSAVEPRWAADVAVEWAATTLQKLAKSMEEHDEPPPLSTHPFPSDVTHPEANRLKTAVESLYSNYAKTALLSQSIAAGDTQRTEEAVSQALYEAAETSLGNVDDEKDVLERIVMASRKLLAADRCSVFVADDAKRELHTIIEGRTFYMDYGQGIAGTVARTGCALLIQSAYEDPRFDSKIDQELGYVTRDILCMPISLDDRLVAVVQLVNKIDGTFTEADESLFASFARFAAMRIVNSQLFREQQRLALRNTMIAEVTESLANTALDESVLIPVIIKNAKAICGADRCAFFQVDEESQQLTAHLEGVDDQISMPMGSGIAGWCAANKQILNVTDAYSDPRFNKEVDHVSGYQTFNILCIPIFVDHKIVAVSQLVNKMQEEKFTLPATRPTSAAVGHDQAGTQKKGMSVIPFTQEDEEVLSAFAAICGVCVRNCRLVESVSKRQAVLESTLEVAKTMLNSDVTKPQDVMLSITQSACRLCSASRCILYMMDEEYSTLCAPNPDEPGMNIEIPVGAGIIGKAAKENKMQFKKDVGDADTASFGTCAARTVVASPISAAGKVLGVVGLANKHGGQPFTEEDNELVNLFTVFAACVIRDARLFATAQQESEGWTSLMAIGRAKTDAEIQGGLMGMSNRVDSSSPTTMTSSTADHSTPEGSNPILPCPQRFEGSVSHRDLSEITYEQAQKYLDRTPKEKSVACLASYEFDIHRYRDGLNEDPEDLVPLIYRIFEDLGLVKALDLEPIRLMKFILSVRMRYRNVPYHSFFHAFDVTQTMYTMLVRSGLHKQFPPHELLAAIIAALVHDVDHRGLNNSFHLKAETPMGILTNLTGQKAVLEVHHATIAVELLGALNLFKSLTQEQRTEVYKLIIDAVLATDMAAHKEHCETFENELVIKGCDTNDPLHRRLLILMLLKSADISNITKDFDISRKWGISVMEEFYNQGDIERRAGVEVTPMFDREKRVELAKGQIGFISFMGRPFFTIVTRVLKDLEYLVDGIDTNVTRWNKVLENTQRLSISQNANQK